MVSYEQKQRQSPERSPSSTISHDLGQGKCWQEEEVVLDSSFDTSWAAKESLLGHGVSVSATAHDYIECLQDFQASLCPLGFADHPGIVVTGVMQDNPTVERVL